jgi:hypothetical protein
LTAKRLFLGRLRAFLARKKIHIILIKLMFFNGHTATLLATARWLKQFEAELPQPVVLIFQPAEEGFHGARE